MPLLCVALFSTIQCRRPPPGDLVSPHVDSAIASPSPTPSSSTQRPDGSSYTSEVYGFAVEFPFPGPPTVQALAPQQTAVGRVLTTSHYASRGDTAFDVQVTRFPKDSLAEDINGLLKADRDQALQAKGARLVRERMRPFVGPGGAAVQGLELVIDMPGDVKVFRVTCFVADRSYTLSAGGPASDATLSDATFQRFVASFRLFKSE